MADTLLQLPGWHHDLQPCLIACLTEYLDCQLHARDVHDRAFDGGVVELGAP